MSQFPLAAPNQSRTFCSVAARHAPEDPLPKVPDARRPGRAAVNALRTLLERHNHIVQEVDGQNDFGEDQHVTFTEDGEVTGDLVKIQVKGGRSWRRVGSYAVPVGDHGSTWADGNIPVLCVVHDPDTDGLHWANATKQLLSTRRNGLGNRPSTIHRFRPTSTHVTTTWPDELNTAFGSNLMR